jgi:alpha-tubulin suppressor-like RCC1 family protein
MKRLAARRSADRSPAILIIAGLLAASLPSAADTPPAFVFAINQSAVPRGQFSPVCVALDTKGNIYVTDSGSHRVVKFAPNGSYLGEFSKNFPSPTGIVVDRQNYVYMADANNSWIYKFNSSGALQTIWGTPGSGSGQLRYPQGLALDRNNILYVADEYNDRVEKFTTAGGYMGQWGPYYAAEGVATDSSNNVYVLYYGNVQVLTSGGAPITNWGAYATAIAVDPSNNVYVGDVGGFVKYTSDGMYLSQVGSPQQSGGVSVIASGIAVDATGNFVYHTTYNSVEVYAYAPAGPPLIYQQPTSQIVPAGVNVTNNASVFGGLPLSYQWLFNGTNIPGATNASLSLTNVTPDQAGTYNLQVANGEGTVTSSNALLVVAACFVTTQPPYVSSASSALLNGMVTPGGQETTAWFEWGTNTSYGNFAGVTTLPASENTVRAVQGALNGLSADYVYHFRLGGSNVLGITYGADQQFTVGRKVFGWGENDFGQIRVPGDWNDVVAIAAGGAGSLALKNDGTAVAWGLGNVGQTNVPPGLSNVVAVTTDGEGGLALKNDGTVAAWGPIYGGQTRVPPGLSNVVAISGGAYHSLALKRDGTVVGWGDNYYGQSSAPTGSSNVVAVAAGNVFSLALKNDGTVVAWGDNYYGEAIVPPGLRNVVAIAAGGSHSLGLKGDGTVVAWGDNTYGQTRVPVGLSNIVAIAAGGWNSLALRNDGTVVAWGDNSQGQRNVPSGLSGVVVGIAAGGGHNLVLTPFIAPRVQTLAATGLTTDTATLNAAVSPEGLGTIAYFRWGTSTNYSNVTPVADQGSGSASLNISSVITGLAPATVYHFQVVASNLVGTVFGADISFRTAGAPFANTLPANGISSSGAVLNGMVSPNQFATTAWFEWGTDTNYGNVVGLMSSPAIGGVVNLKSGISGLSSDSIYHYRLVATNSFGQAYGADRQFTLGRKVFAWGSYNCFPSGFISSPGLTNVVAVGGNGGHAFGLKNDGTVAMWRNPNPGCFYNNDPLAIVPPGLTNVLAISVGDTHCLALNADGTVFGWGNNYAGQINVPPGLSNVIAISAAGSTSLALRSDGTVVAWGAPGSGYVLTNVPTGLNNVVAIATGGSFSLALKDDGTVVGWGGQLAVPASATNVVAIAAGSNHGLALKSDGTTVAWGDNYNGQLLIPPGLSNVVAIAAGSGHSLALKNDGNVVAWGDNSFGQTRVPAALSNVVVGIGAGALQSFALTPRTTPSAITFPATYASANSVYLNATVNPNELDTVAWFRWGTTTNYGNVTVGTDVGSGSADLSVTDLVSGLVSNTYHFQAVASNALGIVFGGDMSFTMSAPFITAQPQPLTLYPGGPANFSVTVGGLGPFTFQWVYNDTNIIAGATNSTYAVANVQFRDAGNYSCVIVDPLGSVTSTNALLSVVPIPNNGYVVSVLADGPLGYWRLGETNGTIAHDNLGGHDGQYTNVTLGVSGYNSSDSDTAIQVGPRINSFVANIQGIDFSSSPAFSVECWVNAPRRPYYDYNDAGIVTKGTGAGGEQFDLDTGYSGGYRFFVRDASGSGLGAAGSPLVGPSNTWQHLVGVYDGPGKQERLYVNGVLAGSAPVAGNGLLSTAHPVTIGSRQSYTYGGPYDFNFNGRIDEVAIYPYALSTNQVLAHYGAGTNLALAGVLVIPGTTNVSLVTVSAGMDASFFVAAASGGPFAYQWYFNTNTPLSGATNASLILRDVQAANSGSYTVVVTGPAGTTSGSAVLTVAPALPVVTSPPTDVSTIPGVGATFSVIARGTEPLAYQWQFNEVDIPGATNSVLGLSGVRWDKVGGYRAVVKNSVGSVPSASAKLSLYQVASWPDNYSFAQTNVPSELTNVVAIAAGGLHDLALNRDGTIAAWGNDYEGETDVPPGLTNVVAIAAGYAYSLALNGNGTVVAWGDDSYGQTNVPTGLSGVVAIAAGDSHGVALKADGTIVAWGYNYSGQTNVPEGLSNVVAIAAGGSHSLALQADGTVLAWGDNYYGATNVPAGLSNVVAIAAGDLYSLALRADGTVVGWGYDGDREIDIPQGLSNVVAIASGYYHSLALKADGTAVSWGYDPSLTNVPSILTNVVAVAAGSSHSLALIGDGPPFITTRLSNPTSVDGQKAFVHVASAGTPPLSYQWSFNGTNLAGATDLTLALSDIRLDQAGDYSVTARNAYGAASTSFHLGIIPVLITESPQSQTVIVESAASFSVAALGRALNYQWRFDGHDLAGQTNTTLVLTNVQLAQAGVYSVRVSNAFGMASSACDLEVVPLLFTAQPTNQAAVVGTSVSFDVEATGPGPFTYQWQFNGHDLVGQTNRTLLLADIQVPQSGGYSVVIRNAYGAVSSDAATLSPSVVAAWGDDGAGQTDVPPGLIDVVAVAAGLDHSLALRGDGSVVAWGWDYGGQTDVPDGLSNVVAIAGGEYHSLALKADGTVVGWGWGNGYLPPDLTNVIAVAAGGSQSLALLADHTVAGSWPVPPDLSNVVAIAAGYDQDLALKEDGTVAAWGYSGPIDAPPELTNVVAIAAGIVHNLALKSDGTVVAWGDNSSGQAKVPAGLSNVVAIAAGRYHSLALKVDGTVVAWGGSYSGETNVPPGLTNVVAIASEGYHNLALIGVSPWITRQPQNRAVVEGDAARFDFEFLGARPLSYQWAFNGTNIAGATDATLTLPKAQKTDQGAYSVFVSNRFGVLASSNALLLVDRPPFADASATAPLVISPNGVNATVILDGSRSSDPDGDPLQYLWLFTINNQPSTILATGTVAVVVLPVGTYSLLLVVSDFLVARTNAVTLEVITTAEAVVRLAAAVNAGISGGQPLLATLNAAFASIQRGDSIPAINQLLAFQNKVRVQVAPLEPALAATLSRNAQAIIVALSGGNTNPSGRPHGLAIAPMPRHEGHVGLKFNANPGQTYLIEASTDLVNWQLIGVAADRNDGTFAFDDPSAAEFGTRFYRVVTPAERRQ